MIFARKHPAKPQKETDGALLRSRAEAEREHRLAEQQARAAETAVDALELTRIRNGFAPAIMAGIINNRKDR